MVSRIRAGVFPIRRPDEIEQIQKEPEDRPIIQQVRRFERLENFTRQKEDLQSESLKYKNILIFLLLFIFFGSETKL